MYYENQQVPFKFNQLKNSKMIHLTRFWNNAFNIKVTPNGKIFHKTDIEKLLGIKSIDYFINITPF